MLGLVYLKQEANLPGESFIELAVTATALLRVFAHGISAAPAINVYAKQVESKDADASEHQDTVRMPVRYQIVFLCSRRLGSNVSNWLQSITHE